MQGHTITCIDYTNLRESKMIELGTAATDALLADEHRKLIVTCYKNTFATPGYVRHMEKKAPLVKDLILRNAIVGLNAPKIMILKGFNLLVGTDFRPFFTEREAIEYLIDEPLSIDLPVLFQD